jgi:hypothetical protein
VEVMPNARTNQEQQVWIYGEAELECYFLIDGIKRDQLPWAGDLCVSRLVYAYAFQMNTIIGRECWTREH